MKFIINKRVDIARDDLCDPADRPLAAQIVGTRTLADLRIGARARVTRLSLERGTATRLMELGLLPGTPIEVARIAPLGDPMEVRLRGYSLSIRRAEAVRVDVEMLDEANRPEHRS